ncbi:MAG: pilus assembly protein TadG-related protein [Terracidiphilus sp.]
MRKWAMDESGQVLVVTMLCLLVLMGMLGMALDVGWLYRAKREAQIAADAAAVAAALDFKYNGDIGSARTQGRAASASNGITNGVNGAVVNINIPPSYGPNQTGGFIEAIVTTPTPTLFMNLFGTSSVRIAGRAVVGAGSGSGCVWALARTGDDISYTGSGGLKAQNCSIYDDSGASNALTLTGSGSITAKSIGISGNYSNVGSGTISPKPVTGMAPAADPLSSLPAPNIPSGSCSGGTYTNNGSTSVTVPSGNCTIQNTGSGNMIVPAGTYTSISNTGSGTLTLDSGNYIITGSLTNTGSGGLDLGAGNYTIGGNFSSTGSSSISMGSGLYEVGGNLTLTGSGPLAGSGDTFYTQGSTTVTGSSNLSLTAPTSGTYSGVLFFQSRSDSSAVAITGSSSSTIQGIVYAPKAGLTLTGSGNMTVSLDIITDSLTETGSGTVTVKNYSAVVNTSSVLGKMVMVE